MSSGPFRYVVRELLDAEDVRSSGLEVVQILDRDRNPRQWPVQDGGDVAQRQENVLSSYALVDHAQHDGESVALLHRGGQVVHAQRHLHELIRGLLAEGVEAGVIRDDVPADELTKYCLSALSASSSLPPKAAVRRLITVTSTGLRP